MHGRALSLGLHWGQRLQEILAERAYAGVREENWHDQRKHGEIYPGELICSGTYITIRVEIYTMHHLLHGG